MKLTIVAPDWDPKLIREELHGGTPEIELEFWPHLKDPTQVEFIALSAIPDGIFKELPNLKVVAATSAGVEHLTSREDLPSRVEVVRIASEGMIQSVVQHVVYQVLDVTRGFEQIRKQRAEKVWNRDIITPRGAVVVLGLGLFGGAIAQALSGLGLEVIGWSRSLRALSGVRCVSGTHGLKEVLPSAAVLVCALPLTSETDGILNSELFAQMPAGAHLINIARGRHLIDEDLIAALDSGLLGGASLDVFRQEPLPREHPFWDHPKIALSPHVANKASVGKVFPQIIENFLRFQRGEPLLRRVDRELGY